MIEGSSCTVPGFTIPPPHFVRHPPLHKGGKDGGVFCTRFLGGARIGATFFMSSRTEPKVLYVIPNECERSPHFLRPVLCEGIPRFADFAPLGLVRRRDRCRQRRRMREQTKKQFPFFPPHQSLTGQLPPKGKPYILLLYRKQNHAFAPRYPICAYLRASRQGAFCGHSAQPNATPFTPAAPLSPKSFPMKIFWR